MDPLSNVLAQLKLRTFMAGGFEQGNIAVQFPPHAGIKCYALVRGRCWLSVESAAEGVQLEAGDCFLLPRGLPFCLATHRGLPPQDALAVLQKAGQGAVRTLGTGGDCFILGGHFVFDGSHARTLLGELPPVVHLRSESDRRELRWSLERMRQELEQPRPGTSLMAQQLATAMLVQALRLHLAELGRGTGATGWLAALANPQMHAALSAMHAEPGRRWTLASLAALSGMSRSVFAMRFKAAVGTSPLEYLTRWRMLLAADRLGDGTGEPVSSIAASFGYESESAFSKAFRRCMGSSPRQHRQARAA